MDISQWISNLAARLELAADDVDDLAKSVWVTNDDDRERLFAIEAQMWRIARTTRRASGPPAAVLPLLEHGLRAVRTNVAFCIRLPVCEEEEGVGFLEGLVHELDTAIGEIGILLRPAEATTGGEEPARPSGRVAGGRS